MKYNAEFEFLNNLFFNFNDAGIYYAVMRNHQSLPFSHGGSDLDILIHASNKQQVQEAIDVAVKSSNAIKLGTSFSPAFFKIYVLGNNSAHHNSWWGLCIDINLGLYFKGLPLLDENLRWPNELHQSVQVLPTGFSGVLGVLKEVLHNGLIPDRYLPDAYTVIAEDWPIITRLLSPMGPEALDSLHELLLQKPAYTQKACVEVRSSFFRHRLLKNPFIYILGRLSGTISKVLRYLKPSGMVIAILGTDGAGKSTIINAIKPALDQATHNTTIIQHLRPKFLPPLGRFKHGHNYESLGPVTNPHGSSPSGFIGSIVRILYATLNYILGYWFETRVHIAKQPTVVIFDRYAYDMLIDQRRFRIALPAALVRFFVRCAPKPDLIFCLVGSPEIIVARKKELPLDEVTNQVRALQGFASANPRAVLINTERSIDVCRDQILQAIINHCKARAI